MSVADCMGGGGVEETIISMPVPGSRRVGEWEELAESGDYMMPSYSGSRMASSTSSIS